MLVDERACVGRWPGGYLPNERCEITVAGPGGALGPCPVFDLHGEDWVTLADGNAHSDADCPAGAALAPGGSLRWLANRINQAQGDDHGGLPMNHGIDAGGGWQVCYA